MNEKERKFYEAHLKKFGKESSLMTRLIASALDHEKRIIELEDKLKKE